MNSTKALDKTFMEYDSEEKRVVFNTVEGETIYVYGKEIKIMIDFLTKALVDIKRKK